MKIINLGILAHVDAGKTTLTESLLYIRLKTLGLLMPRDLTVYLENDLQLGGAK